jgi:hypothetical protein
MVDVAGSLTAESAGAGDECCVGVEGDEAAEMAMAWAGRVGDIGCTGGVGGAGETGVSRIIASERVMGEGGDGGVKAGGVPEGGVHGGGVGGDPTAGSAGESDGAGVESGIGDDGESIGGPRRVGSTGDSCSLSSESVSRNNSTSQRRLATFRVRLAKGGDGFCWMAGGRFMCGRWRLR